MDLEHSFTVPVPPERAWQTLLDVERVAPCMPGASVDSVEDDKISGRIKVKVGPVMLTYTGTARFTERDDQAHSVTLEASGKETRGAGTASAVVRSSLRDEGGQTRVTVNTTLTVTGRPAQFGRGVMAEVGGRIIEKFATNLAAQLAGGEVGAPPAGAGAAPAPAGAGAPGAGAAGAGAAGAGAGPAPAETGPAQAGAAHPSGMSAAAMRDLPIDELQLPVRAYNTLRREGVLTIGNLCDSTEARLLEIEHIGPQAIKEIRQKLAERGLSLAEPSGAAAPAVPAAQSPASAGGPAEAAIPAGPEAAGPEAAAREAAPSAAAEPAPEMPRPPRPPEEEALDLLDVAGFPVLKRALPAAVGVAAVLLVCWRLSRRLRRRFAARS